MSLAPKAREATLIFLGTGTSSAVPEIACDCLVCCSSNPKDKRLRASVLIRYQEEGGENYHNIIIDAGPDFRYQLLREKIHELQAILLTHEHYDHVGGLDDIRPLFRKKAACPLYLEEHLATVLKQRMPYAFKQNPYPGVPSYELHIISPNQSFCLDGGLEVMPVRLLHGKLPIIGFRIGPLAYLTDVKTIPLQSLKLLRGIDTLIIDALRFYPHISHMHVEDAIRAGESLGVNRIYLTHMAHTIGLHDEVNELLKEMSTIPVSLAYDGLQLDFLL